MKNVQVVDGAINCSYEVFAVTDEEFAVLFPDGTEVEFISDFEARVGKERADKITKAMWVRRQDKRTVNGIHGTLFYELDIKKKYYPTKRESDLDLTHAERDCSNYANLINAAESGNAEAQYQFAAMLATGDGAEQDTEKAAYWYRKAAAKKHPEALYNLGLMYLHGETARGTKEKGRAYIEEAADRGSWDANWFLGQVYLKGGYGLKKDPARAVYHLPHALGCKFANAALMLGLALKQSRGMKASTLSDAFIHIAARNGEKEALSLIPPALARRFRKNRAKR